VHFPVRFPLCFSPRNRNRTNGGRRASRDAVTHRSGPTRTTGASRDSVTHRSGPTGTKSAAREWRDWSIVTVTLRIGVDERTYLMLISSGGYVNGEQVVKSASKVFVQGQIN
jgi:hypothetical protein